MTLKALIALYYCYSLITVNGSPPQQEDAIHRFFFKVQYIIIQATLS